MGARYYAVTVSSKDLSILAPAYGPYDSHRAAMGFHARALAMESMPSLDRGRTQLYDRRVLLDTGTISATDADGMVRLLQEDPVLRYIFELGRARGEEQARATEQSQGSPVAPTPGTKGGNTGKTV